MSTGPVDPWTVGPFRMIFLDHLSTLNAFGEVVGRQLFLRGGLRILTNCLYTMLIWPQRLFSGVE